MSLALRRGPAPQATFRALSFDGTDLGESLVQKPDRYSYFENSFPPGLVIARGAGLSYAAASFGRTSISVDMGSFDRFLAVEPGSQIVEVEAGARLGALSRFLAARGRYLTVQPGHESISIGGCVAADVHGKNQARDGTFRDQVESLRLFHPMHGIVALSRTENSDVFSATCGGYGSTGVLLSARLRTAALPSAFIETHYDRLSGVEDLVPRLLEAASSSDFVYTWHDFSGASSTSAKGVLVRGGFVEGTPVSTPSTGINRSNCLSAQWRARGIRVYGSATVRMLNAAYRWKLGWRPVRKQPIAEAFFPIRGAERYFQGYGRAGFHEYQAIVPSESFTSYFQELHRIARRAGLCVPLASAKVFSGVPDLLQFCGTGICLALNVPRTRHSTALLAEFDAVLRDQHGRPNIIKDSRLPMHAVASSYPGFDRFRSILRQWDPERLFRSELTERLQL